MICMICKLSAKSDKYSAVVLFKSASGVLPELVKPEVAQQIQELLDWGFIRQSNSDMARPVVVVLKVRHGENGVRICVDYK